jgi:hypothetical protein
MLESWRQISLKYTPGKISGPGLKVKDSFDLRRCGACEHIKVERQKSKRNFSIQKLKCRKKP